MLVSEYLDPDFEIECCSFTRVIPSDVQKTIEHCWKKKEDHSMADKDVFFLTHVGADYMRGSFLPYRYFYAIQQDKKVATYFQKMPVLQIMGCVRTADGENLYATRFGKSDGEQREWEFYPSGDVKKEALTDDDDDEYLIDLSKSHALDLQKQTGVQEGKVSQSFPFAYAWDKEKHLVYVAMKVRIDTIFNEVYSAFSSDTEYEKISSFPESLEALSPASRKILDLYLMS